VKEGGGFKDRRADLIEVVERSGLARNALDRLPLP
jgi:hypothetical protein